MEKRTEGAWLINHSKKIDGVSNANDFEDIELAGKCGVFLSNLAASHEQSELNVDKVSAIAKVSNISKSEIESVKKNLKDAKLIETSSNGAISVLGLTTASVLQHTSDIFNNQAPTNIQRAAIEISDNISNLPKAEKELKEFISDSYSLSSTETLYLIGQSEEIGFIDYEKLDDNSKFYFNGNLFKRDYVEKTSAVLGSLKQEEIRKIGELDNLLTQSGCVSEEVAKTMLESTLLSKLQSIGMYDYNQVSNPKESILLITKPAAFSKYGNPFEEDALDLAKAFVSSLYYGMNFSVRGRGKINLLKVLMNRLVNGLEVGPATAIGEDYRILELKRVIKLRNEPGTSMYHMRLLKKDIGILALQVLEFGDASAETVIGHDISGNVTNYVGPEALRNITRKKQNEQSKQAVTELLRTFRN